MGSIFLFLYLQGTAFGVCTNHLELKWILNLASATEKHARWRLRLLGLSFKVVSLAGIIRQAAEALSKLPTENADNIPLDDAIPTMFIANNTGPGAAYGCPCFNSEDDRSLELTLPLVAILIKKSSYVQPLTLEEFLKAQWMYIYCKQEAAGVEILGSTLQSTDRGSLSHNQLW